MIEFALSVYFVGAGATFAAQGFLAIRNALRGDPYEINPKRDFLQAILWPLHFAGLIDR